MLRNLVRSYNEFFLITLPLVSFRSKRPILKMRKFFSGNIQSWCKFSVCYETRTLHEWILNKLRTKSHFNKLYLSSLHLILGIYYFGFLGYVVRFAIWYHLYNLKNVKNTHGGVLLLVKLLKVKSLRLLTRWESPAILTYFVIFPCYETSCQLIVPQLVLCSSAVKECFYIERKAWFFMLNLEFFLVLLSCISS